MSGATINYDEAVSGDLADNLPYTFVGSVGAGDNTVTGTISATSDATGTALDIDSFAFDVPAGLTVTNMAFAWTLTTTGSVSLASTSYTLQSGETPLSSLTTLNLLTGTSPLTPFTSSLPIGAGSYNIMNSLFGIGGIGSGDRSWTAHYTWTITAQ